jgi:uncharacterized protein
MTGSIDYGNLMHRAMRSLIKQVLQDVADNGLPGQHHFFITFDTKHPDVDIADWLSDRYPREMTVVVQHWFDNLEVNDDGFAITLNFGDNPEPLSIPYDAIRTFVDPSVEFGLRFETQDGDEDEDDSGQQDDEVEAFIPPEPVEDDHHRHKDAEIVSLDKFRK